MAARSRTSVVGVAVVAGALALAACGGGSHKAKIATAPPPPVTSTTVPGPAVTITPPSGPQGTKYTLAVANFPAGDTVTFVIDIPGGRKFSGQPHTIAPDGTVTTTFQTGTTNPPGAYAVHATGAKGAVATGQFTVDAGATTATSAPPAPATTAAPKATTTTKKP